MKDRKDMHEAYWEAIRVECLIKRYRLQKGKLKEGKLPETTKANVIEPSVENVKVEIEEQKQEPVDSTISLNEVTDRVANNIEQQVQAA